MSPIRPTWRQYRGVRFDPADNAYVVEVLLPGVGVKEVDRFVLGASCTSPAIAAAAAARSYDAHLRDLWGELGATNFADTAPRGAEWTDHPPLPVASPEPLSAEALKRVTDYQHGRAPAKARVVFERKGLLNDVACALVKADEHAERAELRAAALALRLAQADAEIRALRACVEGDAADAGGAKAFVARAYDEAGPAGDSPRELRLRMARAKHRAAFLSELADETAAGKAAVQQVQKLAEKLVAAQGAAAKPDPASPPPASRPPTVSPPPTATARFVADAGPADDATARADERCDALSLAEDARSDASSVTSRAWSASPGGSRGSTPPASPIRSARHAELRRRARRHEWAKSECTRSLGSLFETVVI